MNGPVKRATPIVLFFLLFSVTCFVFVRFHQRNYYALGRFMLEYPAGAYNYSFHQQQLQTISNVLCCSNFSNELAIISQAQSANFKLLKVQPIRGVSMVELHYVGSDSNCVGRVASNACVLIKAFYSTNQPSLEVKYVESGLYFPKNWRQRMTSKLSDLF